MMMAYLISALVLALLALIFALQNTATIMIRFLFWSFRGSLAVVLLLDLALGAVIGALAMLIPLTRAYREAARLKRRIPAEPPEPLAPAA